MTDHRSSVVPDVIDALLTLGASLGCEVSDGDPLEMVPGDWLCVGVEDPEGSSPHHSADFAVEWAHATRASGLAERGSVACALWSWSGDDDLRERRAAVFALHGAIQYALRESPTLGVRGLIRAEITPVDLTQGTTPEGGTIARLSFRVAFTARI